MKGFPGFDLTSGLVHGGKRHCHSPRTLRLFVLLPAKAFAPKPVRLLNGVTRMVYGFHYGV
jgi:hypothetical protein